MPDSVPPQEDASLYVLDLLEGAEREAFEANLAQSADLQRQVRELQVNLEALALAAPPRIPRPQVWEAIAKRTAPASPVAVAWWNVILRYARNGWAIAGLIAVAWLLLTEIQDYRFPTFNSNLMWNFHQRVLAVMNRCLRGPNRQSADRVSYLAHRPDCHDATAK